MGRRDHINLSFKTHAKVCKIYKKSFMNIHTIGFYIKYVCGYVCAPSKSSRVNVVFNPTRKHEPSVRSKEEITFGGSESRCCGLLFANHKFFQNKVIRYSLSDQLILALISVKRIFGARNR